MNSLYNHISSHAAPDAFLPASSLLPSCSSFSWETENHLHLLGRTYDQAGDLKNNRIALVPRHFPMKLEIQKETTVSAAAKYEFAGMCILGLHSPIMVDGVNECGLMGALLHYPGYAVYDLLPGSSKTNIHPAFLIGYLLSQCSCVEEIANHLSRLNLTGETVMGQEMKVHYMFSDTTGEAVIIEPDRNGISIHRDTIGVMTNSPDYLWHKTNLRNYTAVTNYHSPARPFLNTDISFFGECQGGGFGLPGDYSSPSRFVRLAVQKHYAVKGKDEIDGISRMFHVFSCVDTPEGILMTDNSMDPEKPFSYEQTLCISAMCAESGTYYFSTAANRRISAVRLNQACQTAASRHAAANESPDARKAHTPEIQYFDLPEKQDISFLNGNG